MKSITTTNNNTNTTPTNSNSNTNSNTIKRLTKDDIIETTGITQTDTIEELEILFLTCDEISSLQNCRNLKILSMLDNGLKKISNLIPVSNTLIKLCLCDQLIVKIENLDLPNLKELYLHRNRIEHIEGLKGCPRIKKLWLFQNKITYINDMHCIPELQECWLQTNNISSLNGFENSHQLTSLGLAGNPINDFEQIKCLSTLSNLRDLSFNDIHFGKCPVVNENGYTEFIMCYLRQIHVLDGVSITTEKQNAASDLYVAEVKAFYESLQAIDDTYRKEIHAIDQQEQMRENHVLLLEKEMSAALSELQKMISEGRGIIQKEVTRQGTLMDNNLKALEKNLVDLLDKTKLKIRENKKQSKEEYDNIAASLCLLERTTIADNLIVDALCDVRVEKDIQKGSLWPYKEGRGSSRNGHISATTKCTFTMSSTNTPDFQIWANLVNVCTNNATNNPNPPSKRSNLNPAPPKENDDAMYIELVKLYNIHSGPTWLHTDNTNGLRVYCVMKMNNFMELLKGGWESLTETPIFSSSSDTVIMLNSDIGNSFNFEIVNDLENTNSDDDDGNFDMTGPKLEAAMKSNIILLLLCYIDTSALKNIEQQQQKLKLPKVASAKSELVSDLRRVRKVVSMELIKNGDNDHDNSNLSNDVLYAIPNTQCDKYVSLDRLGICVVSYTDWDVNTIESKIEMNMMPNINIDKTAIMLKEFETEMSSKVKEYFDQLLEEVDEREAASLRKINNEIKRREGVINHARDEIDKERRTQDNLLREMRQVASENEQSQKSIGGSKSTSKLRR